MATPVVYPPELPGPNPPSTQSVERRLVPETDGVRTTRVIQRERQARQHVAFDFVTFEQMGAFIAWWRDALIYGGARFVASWPSPRGPLPIARKFIGPLQRSYLPAIGWRVEAEVEVYDVLEDAFFVSTIYPILVEDALRIASPSFAPGRLWGPPVDTLGVPVPSLQSGSLSESLHPVDYDAADTLGIGVPSLRPGNLVVSIAYVELDAADTLGIGVPSLRPGNLVVSIAYVFYTYWRDVLPDSLGVRVPSLLSGTLS